MRWKKSIPTPCVHVTENCQTDITSGGRGGYITTYATPLVTLPLAAGSQHDDGGGNTSPSRRKQPRVTFGMLLLLPPPPLYVASSPSCLARLPSQQPQAITSPAHIIIRISSAGLGYVPLQHHSIRGLGKAQKVAGRAPSATQSHQVKVSE